MKRIYLDYNATTPIAPSVREAMLPFLAEHYGNPSSSHSLGRACHEAIEDARGQVAQGIGCDPDEIIFTSCATESNNLALKGLLLRDPPESAGHLVVSAFEHPAVIEPARFLDRLGYPVTIVPCGQGGLVDPNRVAEALTQETRLVSIMHANNEIGTVQPLREIAQLCHQRGVLLHTDAAQSVGKVRTMIDELGVDMLTIAGHKLYAPKGIGALCVRRGIALDPVLHGAGHESGLRAGTENVAMIVGLGAAVSLATKGLEENGQRTGRLRDRLESRLREEIGEPLSINGEGAPRLPNTSSVNFPNVAGGELLSRIPELCASTGSACHGSTTTMSATLKAIGLPPDLARGTVRLSLGWYTTEDELDRAASWLVGAWEELVRR